MRAYLLAFLMSSTAMNLMKLDEFGSVQQHLQPRHIWGLPVPVPDSWEQVSPIIDAGKGMISAMEQTSLADESLRTNGFDSLIDLARRQNISCGIIPQLIFPAASLPRRPS